MKANEVQYEETLQNQQAEDADFDLQDYQNFVKKLKGMRLDKSKLK